MEAAIGTATRSAMGSAGATLGDPLPAVRTAVRDLLLASPAYLQLDADSRRRLAAAMVKVCSTAVALIHEEVESDDRAQQQQPATPIATPPDRVTPSPLAQSLAAHEPAARRPQPLAAAQATGAGFVPGAARQIAGITRAVLNAVSFPRFVTELINGVFKAMLDSSTQQMHSYVELLNNVAATAEGFTDANFGDDRARQWLIERYPGSFEMDGDSDEDRDPNEPPDPDEPPPQRRLRLRPGAAAPSEAALRTDLGMAEEESVSSGDPDRTLVPLARRQLARMRQQMLATMVLLGLQRIVVESGRITASMRFHVDTRSASQEDSASRFDFQNQIRAAGSFGFGPWGASAEMTNTIGYVSTQSAMNTEELNTELDLNSSVEINFKSDYLPLNRLTTPAQASRISANSLNPAEEQAIQARTERARAAATSDAARRTALNLSPTALPPLQSGTVRDAENARRNPQGPGTAGNTARNGGAAAQPAPATGSGGNARAGGAVPNTGNAGAANAGTPGGGVTNAGGAGAPDAMRTGGNTPAPATASPRNAATGT